MRSQRGADDNKCKNNDSDDDDDDMNKLKRQWKRLYSYV